MPILYQWNSDAKDLVIVTFDGAWTWDDFYQHIHEVHNDIKTVPHTVDMLLWHKQLQRLEKRLMHFNEAARLQPTNVGKVIALIPPSESRVTSILMTLAKVVRRIYPSKSSVTITTSLKEAEKILGKKVLVRVGATM